MTDEMKTKLKDVAVRAFKTFWQTALATLVVAVPKMVELIPEGWEALYPVAISIGVSALAAGISAAWNGVIAPLVDKAKVKPTTPTDEGNGSAGNVGGVVDGIANDTNLHTKD